MSEGFVTSLTGSFTYSLGPGSTESKLINFEKPFLGTPKISFTVSGNTSKITVSVSSVNRACVGFRMSNGGSYESRTFTVSWNATCIE